MSDSRHRAILGDENAISGVDALTNRFGTGGLDRSTPPFATLSRVRSGRSFWRLQLAA